MSKQVNPPEIDKSAWPDGPWKTEPDRLQWQHAGYACLIQRHPRHGTLCGYVGVDRPHPLYEKSWKEAAATGLEVHGGLTYSNRCDDPICHLPEPGMPEDVWWLGFDAAHAGDLCPGLIALELSIPQLKKYGEQCFAEDVYRDVDYMRRETEQLAEQLRFLAAN